MLFFHITISKYTGHPKPFELMKNYFYFELLTCTIPTVTVLASRATYPLFIKSGSKGVALFLTSIFNSICTLFFSKLMIKTILAENKHLENIDLMPGSFILTGYFDGLFFGNLLPQDINTFGFWLNVLVYYGISISTVSGIKTKFLEYYYNKTNKKTSKVSVLTLIFNGSRFFSIFPLVLTVFFTHLNSPYFYGSQLYDYITFDWMKTTDKYDNETIPSIFSFEKLSIMIAFSFVLCVIGYFKRGHYVFVEITLPVYLRNIFYTFKICTMFTIGFEYSVQVANVVEKDVIDNMFGPFWRILGIGV